MTIDTKRLATDPGYWDEVAPEGAELFVPRNSFEWRKWEGEIEMFYDDGKWLEAISPWSIKTWLEDRPGATRRPTQKPEVEWDKELPDVGAEKQYYNSEMNEVRECVVISHRHGCAVVEDQDGQSYEAVPPNNFICTKGQRQRDELIDEAWAAISQDYSEESTSQTHPQEYVLNAICQLYDAGLLHKPEGE